MSQMNLEPIQLIEKIQERIDSIRNHVSKDLGKTLDQIRAELDTEITDIQRLVILEKQIKNSTNMADDDTIKNMIQETQSLVNNSIARISTYNHLVSTIAQTVRIYQTLFCVTCNKSLCRSPMPFVIKSVQESHNQRMGGLHVTEIRDVKN